MPENRDTLPEAIKPTGRHVGLLSPTLGTADGSSFGVLRPFSGLLQPDRYRQTDRSELTLEYLTLQSLVVEHVRERTVRETNTETVERTETTGRTGDTVDDTDASPAESMTVREYIQHQQTGDESDSSDPEGSADASSNLGRDLSGVDDTEVRRRDSIDESRSAAIRQDETPTPSRDTGTGDRPEISRSPTDPSPGRSEPPPWTTIDRTASERGGSEDSDRGSIGPSGQTDTASTTQEQGDPFGGRDRSRSIGPDLVVANSPLPGDSPSVGGESTDTLSTSRSSQSTAPEPSSDQPLRGGRSASRDESDRGRTAMSESPSETSWPSPSTQTPGKQTVPLSLDQVEQPTLDRFVEQLSEKLARHERVERERRGL